MIVKMIFGSHLYGTDTPVSDKDFKGVDMPTWEQIALGKIPKNIFYQSTGKPNVKNSVNDTDIEIYSLHEFIRQCLQGQTGVFDMLHAPESMLIETSPTWEFIVQNREKFYSRNVHAFIGYAMGQAAKYGLKGSRLDASKEVMEWFEKQNPLLSLEKSDLATFPKSEHIRFMPSDIDNENMINVCGKKLTYKAKNHYNYAIIKTFYETYGQRAKLASENKAIDWKAISHAFRAAYQTKELFTAGAITFPRPEAEFLKQIKSGGLDYPIVARQLDSLIEEVKDLNDKSTLPVKPDHEFWNDFLISKVRETFV